MTRLFDHEADALRYGDELVEWLRRRETVLTVCFQDGWPNAPHRALRNRTFEMWEAAGCPPAGKRPAEGQRTPSPAHQSAAIALRVLSTISAVRLRNVPCLRA
jgi:hypothetical protein